MSNIDTINVGGLDYSIEDSTARDQATSAVTVSAYVENGNTASRAYPVLGTPVNWKGSLYYTTATIAQGATLSASNLTAAANIGQMLTNIKTYVGSDSKLHFTDATGADSVLPFNSGLTGNYLISSLTNTPGVNLGKSGSRDVWRSGSATLALRISITSSGITVLSGSSLSGATTAQWDGDPGGGGTKNYSTASFRISKI